MNFKLALQGRMAEKHGQKLQKKCLWFKCGTQGPLPGHFAGDISGVSAVPSRKQGKLTEMRCLCDLTAFPAGHRPAGRSRAGTQSWSRGLCWGRGEGPTGTQSGVSPAAEPYSLERCSVPTSSRSAASLLKHLFSPQHNPRQYLGCS